MNVILHELYLRINELHPMISISRDTARSVEDAVIEILNGGEILVNCKFRLIKNFNLNLHRLIPRNSEMIQFVTCRYR